MIATGVAKADLLAAQWENLGADKIRAGAKAKNVPEEKKGTGAGDVWIWTAIDADSKLILSYLCGGRDASWACQFVEDLASRVTTRIQIDNGRSPRIRGSCRGCFWNGRGLRDADKALRRTYRQP